MPEVSLTRCLACEFDWDARQLCFVPRLDAWGTSSVNSVAVVGDGAGISGARSAQWTGALAGLEAAHQLGHIDQSNRDHQAQTPASASRRAQRIRPLLETLYRPSDEHRIPGADDVVVCRCEEVRAGTVRAEVAHGAFDPNAVKSRTRCGMGPCQGRYCGLTVTEIIAAESNLSPQAVGYYRLRPPVKPIALDNILALDSGQIPAEVALPDPVSSKASHS